MDEYKQYLAQKLLTEDQLVTYRLLSRALKVHVNTAKEMLYDFHKWQNDKRPNSLHATYMIYGTKKQTDQQDGDVEMTNSQDSDGLHVPLSDEVPIQTLSLVKEEKLQEVLAQYDEVTSIHVYSLAPHPLKDLQLLADTARQVLELSSGDNAPASEKVFGAITNPNMWKRERRGPPPRSITNAPAPKVEPKAEAKPTTTVPVKEEPKAPTAKAPTTSAPIKKPTPAASGKRQAASGIGQMFAKAAAKPKKPAAPKPAEKEKSAALSDDGEDDDAEPMTGVKQEDQEDSSARQSRKDRQAELERMMDEDDEDEDDDEKADSPAEEPMEEDEPEPEPEPTKTTEKEEEEEESTTTGGRRRGRRRVTRKKQILDDQGYLVTIQEPGWESFSEDEAPAAPPKPKAAAKAEPAAAAGTTKPKKGAAAGGKGGQGNIMSFFSKK